MPPRRSSSITYRRAIALRKELTLAEHKLWAVLRGNNINGVSFRRQHAIGAYITDFCCIKARLIIELDGGQHLDQVEYDLQRTRDLEEMGYRIIRFWNKEVMTEMDGVLSAILIALQQPEQPPSQPPPNPTNSVFVGRIILWSDLGEVPKANAVDRANQNVRLFVKQFFTWYKPYQVKQLMQLIERYNLKLEA